MPYIYNNKAFYMFQLVNESLSLTLALGAGMYAYSYMNTFIRTLFLQLVIWIFFFVFSHILTAFQDSTNMNNQWVFYIHIPLELLVLNIAACYFLKDKLFRYLSISLYSIFMVILLFQLSHLKPREFINYAVVASGINVTVLYTFILYKKFKSDPASWKRSPEVIASIGLIIYFACNVPYFSLFNYLNAHYPALSFKLFHMITDVLANVRYLCLAVAFWLVRKNSLAVNPNPIQ